ncbi:MAG: inositol monophosphatase family protein [Balneolaceae bacterium]|nr:inositol monophosphatase family protein [Balneolaceae bacterium]
MADYSNEMNLAREAAYAGADIIKSYQANFDFKIDLKGKNDLVTEADLEVEKRILEIITDAFPDDHILAEETEQGTSLPVERTWLETPSTALPTLRMAFPFSVSQSPCGKTGCRN